MRTLPGVFWALPAVFALVLACGGAREAIQQPQIDDAGLDAPADAGAPIVGEPDQPIPCSSSAACQRGEVCTTEDGVCNPPPGCRPGDVCPALCYGTCGSSGGGERCGPTVCAPGTVCCNASCGTCTPPGAACTQQACEPPPAGACKADFDCRTYSDYCAGCSCGALSVCDAEPVCTGPGVQCFVDPCASAQAYCASGRCALRPATETCSPGTCGPSLGMPNHTCPDGATIAGPSGRCLRQPDGSCGWEVLSCPDLSICG